MNVHGWHSPARCRDGVVPSAPALGIIIAARLSRRHVNDLSRCDRRIGKDGNWQLVVVGNCGFMLLHGPLPSVMESVSTGEQVEEGSKRTVDSKSADICAFHMHTPPDALRMHVLTGCFAVFARR